MKGIYVLAAAAFATLAFGVVVAFSEGNSTRGQRVFGACAACHSLRGEHDRSKSRRPVELKGRKRGKFQPIFACRQIREHRLERQDVGRLDS